MIDAHQHFWSISRQDCTWPTPDLKPIYRDFDIEDYKTVCSKLEIHSSVLVQSQQCNSDTDFLLKMAKSNALIGAVVGWVDMESQAVFSRLEYLASQEKFRGIRPMLQSIEDADWILQKSFSPILEKLQTLNLSFDALIQTRHLLGIAELARRHPSLKIVVGHAAKPNIAKAQFSTWARDIEELARHKNVFCKLSGLLTEASPEQQRESAIFIPYIQHLLGVFGCERLMWGSDWPVVNLATSAEHWFELIREWAGNNTLGKEAPDKILGTIFFDTAKYFYRIQQ